MTAKLPFLAEQDGYSGEFSHDAIGVKLAGGAMRIRADFTGAAQSARISLLLNQQSDYAVFMSFWAFDTRRGTLPFLVDLILESAFPMQYMCRMVPGTFKMNKVEGHSRRVSMEVEAEQNPFTIAEVQFSNTGSQVTIIDAAPNAPDAQVLLSPGDLVQIAGASVNNGVNPRITLDGIYTVNVTPTPTIFTLVSPATVNPDWTVLAGYPSGLSGNIEHVYIMRVPA
jgi:hypothetical protein